MVMMMMLMLTMNALDRIARSCHILSVTRLLVWRLRQIQCSSNTCRRVVSRGRMGRSRDDRRWLYKWKQQQRFCGVQARRVGWHHPVEMEGKPVLLTRNNRMTLSWGVLNAAVGRGISTSSKKTSLPLFSLLTIIVYGSTEPLQWLSSPQQSYRRTGR